MGTIQVPAMGQKYLEYEYRLVVKQDTAECGKKHLFRLLSYAFKAGFIRKFTWQISWFVDLVHMVHWFSSHAHMQSTYFIYNAATYARMNPSSSFSPPCLLQVSRRMSRRLFTILLSIPRNHTSTSKGWHCPIGTGHGLPESG